MAKLLPNKFKNLLGEQYDCLNLTTVTVGRGSYAAGYCKENRLPYTYPDANDWLNG